METYHNQVSKLKVASEGGSLAGNPLHQATVTGEDCHRLSADPGETTPN